MTTTSTLTLDTVFNATNPACQPLRDGRVSIRGVEMRHVALPNIIIAFRRMCRTLDFGISELAVVTYFAARHYGLPMTAIPVFPASRVDDGDGIFINTRVAHTAKDLEGKTVGMRAYTVTPSAWQRGYLAEQGCDLSKVTFISNDEEHVAYFHADAPKNLHYRKGANLQKMLSAGELAAGFSVPVPDDPDIKPLNPSSRQDGIEKFKRTHVHHVIHLMLVHNRLLAEHPWLLRALYDAFKESKQVWQDERGGGAPEPWDDPMPVGMSETRDSLEALMGLAVAHGVIPRPLPIDELFPGNFD